MIMPELFLSQKIILLVRHYLMKIDSTLLSSKIFWLVGIMKNHSIFKMKSINLMK